MSHYRILEQVGQGGMSLVYKALDLKLNRAVALKFLPPHMLSSREAVVRFCSEARAISSLNHPHIATIYELGKADGELFLALEYLPGGTVRSVVRELATQGERLGADRLLEFAAGIAEGLEHAHAHGIIHRDVKSDNAMLADDGAVKITDFGLAKWRGGAEVTRAGSIVGTVAYMSPEQARGAEVDHRSDIFSYGVVLYEMATGELPFPGPHEAAILSRILNDTPPLLGATRPDLPAAVERIVARAMEKDPVRRYQSMGELLGDLRSVGAGPAYLPAKVEPAAAPAPFSCADAGEGVRALLTRKAGARVWLWPAVLLFAAALASVGGAPRMFARAARWAEGRVVVRPSVEAAELCAAARSHLQRYEDAASVERAIGLFEQALERKPDHAPAQAGLGEAYWRKYKLTRDNRWIAPAGDHCRQAIALDGKLAAAHITMGLIHAGIGQPREAVQEFAKALSLDPLNGAACREMGTAYEAMGWFPDAESAYRRAIEFQPSDWAAHNELGRFYWRQGNYAKAESCFRKVIELTPDNARGYSNLGGLYVMMARFGEAAAQLEESIRIRPTAAAYSNLGTAHFFEGRYPQAVAMIGKAVEMRPEDYQLWGNLADVLRLMGGHTSRAADAYRTAIGLAERQLSLDSGDAAARAGLAGYHAGLGERSAALAEAREAVRRAPSNVNVLYQCALAFELAGRRDEALWTLRAALRGGYSSEEVRRHPDLKALRADPRYDGWPAGRLPPVSSRKSVTAGASARGGSS